MKRNFIFALILLATFSMINAVRFYKRETKFGPCPLIYDPKIVQLNATFNPDPIVVGQNLDITISGKLNVDIPENSPNIIIEVVFLDPEYVTTVVSVVTEFCKSKDINCPVKARTEFSTVLTDNISSGFGKGTTIVSDVYDRSSGFLGCALSDPIS